MLIDESVKASHQGLSTCSRGFLDFVQKTPESLCRASYPLLELHDPLYKLQPWPTFINRRTKASSRDASINLFKLIKAIPGRIFAHDPLRISEYYGTPLDIAKYQLTGSDDYGMENLVGRGDFILSAAGWKCLEYNVAANLGGWDVPLWESLYRKTPVIAKFLKEVADQGRVKIVNENLVARLFEHLIASARGKFSPAEREINMALAVPTEVTGNYRARGAYLDALYNSGKPDGGKEPIGQVIICDYRDLRTDGDYVFYGNCKIHILFEMYSGFVPGDILAVFKKGHIVLFNGPMTGFLSNKLSLALLSEHVDSGIFSLEERDTIRAYIPWTRKIVPGKKLEDNVLSKREQLVIKPSSSYGGKGIAIGRNTDPSRWEKVFKAAVTEGTWLVQEYIPSLPFLYQTGENGCAVCDVAWGFFLFGSEYAGGWVRVLPRENSMGVINCHQGATVSVVFEVEE